MAINELYSKRKKARELAGRTEPYGYDVLPDPLRHQIVRILRQAIGVYGERHDLTQRELYRGAAIGVRDIDSPSNAVWSAIWDILEHEHGLDSQHGLVPIGTPQDWCEAHFLKSDVDHALDFVELSFKFVDDPIRDWGDAEGNAANLTMSADDAVNELNHRLREHAVGYEIAGGEIVRVDCQFLHAEVVRPALALLHDAGFEGPNEEFLAAHRHYREGNNKAALVEALKAFESTMKAICNEMKWPFPEKGTAKDLIKVILDNELIPKYLTSQLSGIRTNLESGLPTVRNKTSGHGQGKDVEDVADHVAAFGLHVAAANIVLLVSSFRAQAATARG